MKYLTAEQILFIHARLIAETGGSHGVHNVRLLESAAARPQVTFDGKELYPDIFQKAAALLESLVNNDAFVDGNKRTGIASAALFLLVNGWRLVADQSVLEEFTLHAATTHPEVSALAAWLRQNCRETPTG